MPLPDTVLFIYELWGSFTEDPANPPLSFIGTWNEDDFTYLFFSCPEDDYVRILVETLGLELRGRHEMPFKDWQTGLPETGLVIEGVRFCSPNFPSKNSNDILLDPTVVFGDGNHPTTRSCLAFLREIVDTYPISTMLDLGTGTGILSLFAGKLGITNIVAVDKNVLACNTARTNVTLNSMDQRISIHQGEARHYIDTPFDLVVANLPYSVLKEIVPLTGARLHSFWIVSGINAEQGRMLQELFKDQGFAIGSEALSDCWLTFVAKREKEQLL